MKVLVVGGGGREHAIVYKLSKSSKVDKIYCAPGNAGISEIAQCVDIGADEIDKLKEFAMKNKIDITIVGPEIPLIKGIVDEFEKEGLKIFGPNKKAAMIEGSKYFAKLMLNKYNIATARFKAFDKYEDALGFLKKTWYPVVIKADGAAQGKGVFIVESFTQAKETLDLMMKGKIFGTSCDTVIIEEMLFGREVSVLMFTDGKTIIPMISAMDYKKIFDQDKGPNTGGMGNIAPNPYFDDKISKEVMDNILKPIVNSLKTEGIIYKGVLYAGLILTDEGPKVLEFNARFGDPEAQVILPLLETDLINIVEAVINGSLDKTEIKWSDKKSVCVVASSKGYPNNYKTGYEITGLDKTDNVYLFHAGTAVNNGKVVTSGGRVLAVTALGDTFDEARNKAYKQLKNINFEGIYYRKDIGLI